jgi:hypothetical protein
MTACPRPRAARHPVRLAVPERGRGPDQAPARPRRAAASGGAARIGGAARVAETDLPPPAGSGRIRAAGVAGGGPTRSTPSGGDAARPLPPAGRDHAGSASERPVSSAGTACPAGRREAAVGDGSPVAPQRMRGSLESPHWPPWTFVLRRITRTSAVRRAAAAAVVGGLVLGLVASCGGSESRAGELTARGAAETAPAKVPPEREPAPDESSTGGRGSGESGATGPGDEGSPESPAGDMAFPEDLQVGYEAREAAGAAGEAVREFGRFWRAWWYAAATGGRDTRYRTYLAPGSFADGGTGLITEVVQGWRRTGQRPTGTIRAHAVRAVPDGKGRVYLEGCGDESKAGAKNVKTGRVDWSFGRSETSRYKFRVVLARAGDGWKIHEYLPIPATEPAGRECRG